MIARKALRELLVEAASLAGRDPKTAQMQAAVPPEEALQTGSADALSR
jgi:hypothetical protein